MAVLVNNIQEKVIVPAELLTLLEETGEFVLRMEGFPAASEVSIVLVDNSYIQELNSTYRGYDSPTDVLSFCLQDNMTGEESDQILGDVFISMEKAKEQAREYGQTLKREVAFLAVHGILHLIGYNHETPDTEEEMKRKQHMVMDHFMDHF